MANIKNEQMGNFVGMLVRRLFSDSPKELKMIRNISGGVAIVGGIAMCFALPPMAAGVLPVVVAIAGGIAGGCQLGEVKE